MRLPPVLALVLATGCTGQIAADAPGVDGTPGADTAGAPRGPGASSPTGGTPAAGAARSCGAGYSGARRLNKRELGNSLHDLLGVDATVVSSLPEDGFKGGFDTNASALGASPELTQALLDVVERAVTQAVTAGRVITCAPARKDFADDCVTQTLIAFAERAYRRPLEDADRTELKGLFTGLAASAADGKEALTWSLIGVLMAPRFLYRSVGRLDQFEYAARLSYFLWSTTPDDMLAALARAGKLDAAAGAAQAARMLKDPRAKQLAVNFGQQWLGLHGLGDREYNLTLYPQLTRDRLTAMLNETAAFMGYVLSSDRRAGELLDADYTFANRLVAPLYGVDQKSDTFVQTPLPRTERRGVLTQASVLASTSHPDRVSVPARGMWIMANLMCLPPPPPPPDNVDTSAVAKAGSGLTLRQRFEMHRTSPACASCHTVMDNMGFALHNYAPTGAYRTMEDGKPIDASGVLPDGRPFANAVELAGLVGGESFVRCVSINLMSYGLGRLPADQDTCTAERVAGEVSKSGATAAELVGKLIAADAFRTEGTP
jgi:hypothetical protein